MKYRILLTGFCHTSAELLLAGISDYDTLLLPNDMQKDSHLLKLQLQAKHYDLVISFGQRPNIKDKVHIETTARGKDTIFRTNVNCGELVYLFIEKGIPAKISENAGTSFCNELYRNGLQFIAAQNLNCALVFVHIPFQKNMCDPTRFQKRVLEVIKELEMKGDGSFGKNG